MLAHRSYPHPTTIFQPFSTSPFARNRRTPRAVLCHTLLLRISPLSRHISNPLRCVFQIASGTAQQSTQQFLGSTLGSFTPPIPSDDSERLFSHPLAFDLQTAQSVKLHWGNLTPGGTKSLTGTHRKICSILLTLVHVHGVALERVANSKQHVINQEKSFHNAQTYKVSLDHD